MWIFHLRTGYGLDDSGNIFNNYSPMDYFLLSFPIEQTNLRLCVTNTRLHAKGKNPLNQREFYDFLGIMILITRFDFTPRSSLWSPTSVDKYIPSVKLRPMNAMERLYFDNIWSEIRWVDQTN